MNGITQGGAALLGRSRFIKLASSWQRSWCEMFSDHPGAETDALFRALDKDTAPEAASENTSKQEKFTLDDFFSNMDKSKSNKARNNRKGSRTRKGSGNPRAQKDLVTESKDMNSFFDEVNSIMKENKINLGRKETIAKTVSTDSSNGRHVQSAKASIFDAIPPSKHRSSNAYDEETFDQYAEMLEQVITTRKFLRKHTKSPVDDERAKSILEWLKADEPVVQCHLPSLDRVVAGGISKEEEFEVSQVLRNELEAQSKVLKDHYGWDSQQYKIAISALTNLGGLCAKQASGAPLDIGWSKLKEAGFEMDKDLLHNYLYVASTFSNRPIQLSSSGGLLIDFLKSNGNSDVADSQEDLGEEDELRHSTDTASEVANVQDILLKPTEQSTSIRVRTLVSKKRAKEAERLLDANAENDDLRLRTYAPVYKAYLDEGDVASAFQLFVKMKQGEHVILQPETFVQLMACIAEKGYFRENSDPIEGVRELGYAEASGPILFDLLASELAEHSVEISAASAKRLYNAFQRGFEDSGNIKPLHLLESILPCNEPVKSEQVVVSRVTLDKRTGRCLKTGTQLRLIGLDEAQKVQLQEGLIDLSTTAYEERSRNKNSKAEAELRRFGEWLHTRTGAPFTAIIDGPNIAYYMQNFQDGIFNYHQIKFVVDALEDIGENVLVILPQKYTQDSFIITSSSGNKRQRLKKSEKKICRDLIESGKAYTVPYGCLDDYYWMYASVSGQGENSDGQVTYISPENADGRWPGVRPMLVSNDRMRDHKLSLLEPRLFRRWFSNFIVNFTFSAFVGTECGDKEIGFKTADFYSREIQGNPSSDGKTTTWHFPVSDWEEDESFCIRIPSGRAD